MEYVLRSGATQEADYTPYGVVREAFLCKDPEVVCAGPADTGKTLGLLNKLHVLASKYPNASLVIARKQQTDVYSSVLVTFQKKVVQRELESGLIRIYGGEKAQWFDYPNGSRIWVAGLDKDSKVLSAEHDIIYVNQAEELSLPDWETVTTRTTGRAGHMPYAQTLGDCNPSSPTHWIRNRARSGSLTLFNSTHRDNPELFDPTTGLITPGGEQRLSRLRSLTGSRLQRLFHGLWAAPEGAIYSIFEEEKHKVVAFPIPRLWPRFVGIDPIGAYIAAVWLALDPVNKILNVYREYYGAYGLPTSEHAANILALSGYKPNGTPITAAAAEPIYYWVVGQPAERQARLEWQAAGIPASCPAFADVWMGIDRIIALLSDFTLVIHDSCPQLLSEIGDYRRILKDGTPTENIEKKEDYHCLTGDTMVPTERGYLPLRSIIPGDKVLTRQGYKPVLASACTNHSAAVYEVLLSDGVSLVGTGKHPVWVQGQGYIDLQALRYSDIMLALQPIATAKPATVSVHVVSVTALTQRESVYNLEVEDAHEFFANGILVHNCLDGLRYAIVGPEGLSERQEIIQLQNVIGPRW